MQVLTVKPRVVLNAMVESGTGDCELCGFFEYNTATVNVTIIEEPSNIILDTVLYEKHDTHFSSNTWQGSEGDLLFRILERLGAPIKLLPFNISLQEWVEHYWHPEVAEFNLLPDTVSGYVIVRDDVDGSCVSKYCIFQLAADKSCSLVRENVPEPRLQDTIFELLSDFAHVEWYFDIIYDENDDDDFFDDDEEVWDDAEFLETDEEGDGDIADGSEDGVVER